MNDLNGLLKAHNDYANGTRTGTLRRPAYLDDATADPILRTEVLAAYASAVMETPPGQWDAGMRAAVQEETLRVAKEAEAGY